MTKRHVLIGFGLGLVLCGAAVAAYFFGVWIPNYPPDRDYRIRGIDVSGHQGDIHWNLVPHDRIQFAYIKATEGGDFRDSRFAENWKASRAAGLPRGAYHYFTLKTPGLQQASNFTAVVPNELDSLPPAIDLEYWGNSSVRPSVADFRRELDQFVTAVRTYYGREPVLYTGNDYREYYLRDLRIGRLWIRSVITAPRLPKGQDWLFWQYSEKVRVPGISGFVDQNVFYGNEDSFRSLLSERVGPMAPR